MKRYIPLLLLVNSTFILFSQTLTLTDSQTGEPIELATLMSEHPKAFIITNARGQANMDEFLGSRRIEIRALSYENISISYPELKEASFRLELSPSAVTMEEVVIAATRWSQASGDVPSRIVAVSPKTINLQNPQTSADLLGITGKVFIQKSQQGGGSPMIRGFATNRLLYSVDGVRMNNAIFRGGNLQNVISLDPFANEKTEVLLGPGSVIYGSDAIGGVMSFQTLTPQFSLDGNPLIAGKAVTRFSYANNEKTGHFDINVGYKNWAFLTSFSSFNFGDLRMGSHGPDEYLRPYYVQRQDSADVIVTNDDPQIQKPSGYSQINMMQKIHFKPGEKWDFQYGFHYSETSSYSRYDRHIRYKNGLPRYGEWDYGPQKWMMNNLNITYFADQKLYDRLSLRLAQQNFKESRISRDINHFSREIREEEVDALSANLDFIKSMNSRNKLFYGIEYVLNLVNSAGSNENILSGTSAPGPSRYPQADWTSVAIYLNDQYKISESFLLQAGIRYNQFILDANFDTTFYPFPFTNANINDGALTGSIGIVHRPTEEWVISTNVATAFRSPNVDDIGKVFDSEPGSVVVPNPDLSAEYAWNADFSIARKFNNKVKIDISTYYALLKNAMVRRDFTLNGLDSLVYDGELSRVQALQNAAQARVYGIQAGIEVKLPYNFSFTSDLNYQKGVEELDDGTESPSRHAPPMFGNSRLTWSANKLNLQFYSIYSGSKSFEELPEEEKGKDYIYAMDNNGNPWSPAWYTLNFKAMYNMTEHFILSAGLENITDQRYRPYSSGISAAGRNFILGLRMIL